jgi:hypothetical protein
LDINNPSYFETTGDYDFYERFGGRSGGDCLDGENVTHSVVSCSLVHKASSNYMFKLILKIAQKCYVNNYNMELHSHADSLNG